jgi:branched-chain amino acid transport system substrate-binding protein
LNQLDVKSLYLMGPNYAAGKDMLAGVESTFKGEILGKDLTKWPDQLDFSAELAKARASGAEALVRLLPGPGRSRLRQPVPAGGSGRIAAALHHVRDGLHVAAGVPGSRHDRRPRLQVDAVLVARSRYAAKQVSSSTNFKTKYDRYPSFYAAQSYDAMFYIKSAVEAVDGDLSDIDGLRAALRKADFPSVRGDFEIGPNHYPVQNFYLQEVAEDEEGVWTTKIVQTVYEMNQDSHAHKCQMN